MISVGLYLMGKKGLISLHALNACCGKNHGTFKIAYIVGATDSSVANDYASEIRASANANQIAYYDRVAKDIPDADVTIAISWRWLINTNIDKLIVIHDSILPAYRGFNPLVTALIEGDRELGITALKADKEFDKGNIIGVKTIAVNYPLRIEEAIDRISLLYGELVVEIIERYIAGTLIETVQEESKATYSLWRDAEDYHIDWTQSANYINRFIDAVGFPYLGAYSYIGNKIIRILQCTIVDDIRIINRTPGKVLYLTDNCPVVVCGAGMIRILEAFDEQGNKVIFDKMRIRLK